MMELPTAQQILKKDGILLASPSESLSKVVAGLRSSHDAVFITDKSDHLLGIINPYHALFSKRYPGSTKVKNCLFHPPKLNINTPITKVAQLMLESKVYYLPVYQDEQWIGIATINRLLKYLQANPQFTKQMPALVKQIHIYTVSPDDTIQHAYSTMKSHGVSRLPVTDHQGKLLGLITRHDLRGILTQTPSRQAQNSRQGNKSAQLDQPVRGYMQTKCVTAPREIDTQSLIDVLLTNQVNSAIVVDTNQKPIGICTLQDILKMVSAVQ